MTGTSFLLPGNSHWASISDHYDVTFGQYEDWSSIARTKTDSILLWVIFLEDIRPETSLPLDSDEQAILSLLDKVVELRQKSSTLPMVIAFSGVRPDHVVRSAKKSTSWQNFNRAFESRLDNLLSKYSNLYKISLDQVFAQEGYKNCFDKRNYYACHCRLSSKGIALIAENSASILERIYSPPKKLLVLDCDNTLWGGVIGEDGLSGIKLGQDGLGKVFVDFQKAILKIRQEGTLLALSSKNNEKDVWQVFEKHPAMILNKEDITIASINWQDKASNIKQMVKDLNIGLDSVVFWDDNPLEQEKVRTQLTDVYVPDVSKDVGQWPTELIQMKEFSRFHVTEEDLKKNEQYRNRSAFVSKQNSAIDETSFLKSIKLSPSLVPIDDSTIARAIQLCAKTNQFNLRTKRYQEADIRKIISADTEFAFLVSLKDQFGDHGIIGLVIVTLDISTSTAFLDTMLLSCRVLGRRLEAWIFQKIKERLQALDIKYLIIERIPTSKNTVLEDLFKEYNIESIDAAPHKVQKNAGKNCTGDLYIVEVNKWHVPFLEVYNYV